MPNYKRYNHNKELQRQRHKQGKEPETETRVGEVQETRDRDPMFKLTEILNKFVTFFGGRNNDAFKKKGRLVIQIH